MKKSIVALLLTISSTVSAQIPLEYKDGVAQFQKVIDVPGKSAPEIYALVNRWVAITFRSPDKATFSKIENEMVRGEGFHDDAVKLAAMVFGDLKYSWQVDIKDGKARFTMNQMSIATTSSGSYPFEQYVYKPDGTIRKSTQATNVKEGFQKEADVLGTTLSDHILNPEKQKGGDW